jgi:hypothetical protein
VRLPAKRDFAVPAEQVQEVVVPEGVDRSVRDELACSQRLLICQDEDTLGESSKPQPKKGLVFTPRKSLEKMRIAPNRTAIH